ncbi:protein translocase subunit SecD, partial [bacterium]|nr:protein translocase subunit SecD [bacterium]
MKIPWKPLGILVILIASISFNIPTVRTMIPVEEGVEKQKIQQRLERMKDLFKPLNQIQLVLVEAKKSRIQLLVDDDFAYPLDHPILKIILEDNFTYVKNEEGHYLNLKKNAGKDVFVSHVADKLNGLLTNTRKISDIRLDDDKRTIIFDIKKDKRLSVMGEPLKTLLADDFEVSYREEKSQYLTRPKPSEYVINLGLDLQGGMYQDIGVKVDVVILSILDKMVEEIEGNLINDNINYVSITRINSSQIEIQLEPDETFEFKGDNYERLLGQIYEVAPKENNRIAITLQDDEIKRIKKKAVEQALETIRNRIDQLGVKEPSIQLRGTDSDSIVIQLPGLKDPDQARRVINTVAVLHFQRVANEGSIDNPGKDNIVLYEENRDPLTKEVLSTQPWLLEKKILLHGDRIRDSRVRFSETGQASVSLSLDDAGKDEFRDITRNSIGRLLAIVLDGKVQSAPRINEEIAGGEAVITGSFSPEEAAELALVLRSGALPAPIIINEERTIGPSLGADSIRKSLMALCIGFAAVIVFMIAYYGVSGVFAVVALLFNLVLILAFMAYFQATLTLPGMAGIILTIGMAVDANILI